MHKPQLMPHTHWCSSRDRTLASAAASLWLPSPMGTSCLCFCNYCMMNNTLMLFEVVHLAWQLPGWLCALQWQYFVRLTSAGLQIISHLQICRYLKSFFPCTFQSLNHRVVAGLCTCRHLGVCCSLHMNLETAAGMSLQLQQSHLICFAVS